MDHRTPVNIQQQMYTRERRGIFRSTEGFDTIAKSAGLDQTFIKKVLHPFCQYDAPAELTSRGEKDASAFPEVLHLFRAESGEMVLGRSVYQQVDFTGLRSAFFTHNYIIPAQRADQATEEYRSWLHASFAGKYDIEEGAELPELEQIPAKDSGTPADPKALLSELHIDEQVFKQLLFAAMNSVSGKKKVYIVLDVPVEQVAVKAKALLDVLYACLPYGMRRQLGFITFATEPQSKKGIHLMFVEKGSLRLNDRSIEKDYLFELAAGRVINVDLDWAKQPYLDFAWSNLSNPERAESFYSFAEQMLSDMEPERRTSVASYHELSVLYQIEEGNQGLYEAHKVTVLRALLDYLSTSGALQTKKRLKELFMTLFDRELDRVKVGEVPEADVVECLKDYYRIDSEHIESMLVEYLIRVLNNATSQKRKELVPGVYTMIESIPALSRAFFDKVLMTSGLSSTLFLPYIENKLKNAVRASNVIDLVNYWGSTHPIVLENVHFAKLAETQLVTKLRQESDPVKAVNDVLDQLDRLSQDAKHGIEASPGGPELMDRLLYAANLFLLMDLKLDTLTKEQLLNIGFLASPKEFKAWAARFDARIRSKAAVMLAAYQWMSVTSADADVLLGLTPAEMDQVQHLGRKWLQSEVEPSRFAVITLGFCQDIESGAVDYSRLLDFIREHSGQKEMVYRYIQWSAKEPLFVRPRGLVPAYASAIVNYFKKHDRDAFKNKANVSKYFDSAPPVLKPVYAKVRTELASPFTKFFRRNRKSVTLSSFIVLLVVVVGGVLLIMQANGAFKGSDGKEANGGIQEPVTAQQDTPEQQYEVPTVTAAQVKAGEGKNETTQLTFHFTQSEACRVFPVDQMSLLSSDGTELFKESHPDIVRQCADDSAANTDKVDPAGTTGTGDAADTDDAKGTGSKDDGDKTGRPDGTGEEQSGNIEDKQAEGTTDDQDSASDTPSGQTDDKKDKDNAKETTTDPNADGDKKSGDSNQGDQSNTQPPTESLVVVQLGKKIDISKISKIRIGNDEYMLTSADNNLDTAGKADDNEKK